MASYLPTINAILNGTAAILIICGRRAIKQNNRQAHKKIMLTALCVSAAFLVCYVTNHLITAGPIRYQGHGFWRIVYFTILLTHTPLAVIIVPASLTAVYFALKGDFKRHTGITKWLYPVWLYVSITGVVIYFMLFIL